MAETEINAPEPELSKFDVELRAYWSLKPDSKLVRALAEDDGRIERGEPVLSVRSRAALEHVTKARGLPVPQPGPVRPVATPTPDAEVDESPAAGEYANAQRYYAKQATENLLERLAEDGFEKGAGHLGLDRSWRKALHDELAKRGATADPLRWGWRTPEQERANGVGGPRPEDPQDVTPDGRPVVYVGMPSMESQEGWERDSVRRRDTDRAGLEFSIRQAAFDRAYSLHQFDRPVERSGRTERDDSILAVTLADAQTIELYLRGSVPTPIENGEK